MIENIETAKFVSERLLNINGLLNESVAGIEGNCSPEEFTAYRRHVGKLINSVFEEILEPIYRKHPALKPPELEP